MSFQSRHTPSSEDMSRPRLTKIQDTLLWRLRYDPSADLVYDEKLGWWCGWDTVDRQVAAALIRFSLVTPVPDRRGFTDYRLTAAGSRYLDETMERKRP